MPFVVTENCSGCRFTDCVEVCPVSCFHGDNERIYIDPIACIDCAACVPLCPVQAIYEDLDVPEGQEHWIEKNAEMASSHPAIIAKQPLIEGAEERMKSLGFSRSA